MYCFFGACCAGRLHERTGENYFGCLLPGTTQALRTKIRMAYGIKVSIYRCVFFRSNKHLHSYYLTGFSDRRLPGVMLRSVFIIANEERARSSRCTRSICQVDKSSELSVYDVFFTIEQNSLK